MHIAPVSSAHTYALLSHWTLVTKHKLKDRIIKNFYVATVEH